MTKEELLVTLGQRVANYLVGLARETTLGFMSMEECEWFATQVFVDKELLRQVVNEFAGGEIAEFFTKE